MATPDFERRVYDRTHDLLARLEAREVEVNEFSAMFARSAARQMEELADAYLPPRGDSTPPPGGVG